MFDCRGMAFSEAGFQASACDSNVRGFKLHHYPIPSQLDSRAAQRTDESGEAKPCAQSHEQPLGISGESKLNRPGSASLFMSAGGGARPLVACKIPN